MLSICIPVYNFDVNQLVNDLSEQVDILEVPVEIIIIDDASNKHFKQINEQVCREHNYIELDKNIGRAAIRNKFLEYSKFDYLLFLDCDSVIISKTFLNAYLDTIKTYPKHIICGGRVYQKKRPKRDKMLRWKYGFFIESKPVEIRKKQPNKSFMTNNFLVYKPILSSNMFDERLSQYGHEDTLFGFRLKQNGIEIQHIGNEVLNGDLDTNSEYLKKTVKAIENLVKIQEFLNFDKSFITDVKLIKTYYLLKPIKLPIKMIFKLLKPCIEFMLLKGHISLIAFSFYKLGTFIIQQETHKTQYNLL